MGRKRKASPEQEAPETPTQERKKAAGRTIGAWRKDALRYLGKGSSDSDVTAHVNQLAREGGYDYTTDDAETAEWRARVQAELDGDAPPSAPRTPRAPRAEATSEPTLTDVIAVLSEMKRTELPDTH